MQPGQQTEWYFACFVIPHHNCIYNCLSEFELPGPKPVEDIKIKD